jgi:hypothetical protein
MAESCNGVIHIGIATTRAGVGGVTFLGTGGSSYNCLIVMTEARTLLTAAAVASSDLNAALGISGLHNNGPIAPLMAECSYAIVNVGIAADGTSVGGVTILSTSGSSYNCLIVVLELFGSVCDI